ncbi:MAG: cupredoxin family copper-binding protein [Candidatus Baltobacteraceae bacterium]|jgi:plastocyanin
MQRFLFAAAVLAFSRAASGAEAPAAESGSALLPAVVTIHIKDFTYAPTPATVRAGDRVTFVNDDGEAHTVTSDDKSFDSEGLDGGGTWQHVFTKPGTYHYFCELHPYMKATIVVVPSSGSHP